MAMVDVSKPAPRVRQISLNDPETLNALSFALVGDLYKAIQTVQDDNDCAVVILTGNGRGFCSGMNLDEVGSPPNIEGLPLSRVAIRAMEYMADLVPTLRNLRQPVIAAINGPAYGGGMCLALGADIRVGSSNARFRAAGINNGLSGVELGASFLLPRLIGAARGNEIVLTGREVSATEAEKIGLMSEVVHGDNLPTRALEIATQICKYSAHGVQMTKQLLWSALECSSLEAAIDLENRNQLLVRMTTHNLEEAIAARNEGREPTFKD